MGWRAGKRKLAVDLREGKSLLYSGRRESEVLSLGWDGLLYPDAMFMHTQTYPIGDIRKDTPYEAVVRANKDPLLCRLYRHGFGSVFRVAKKADPTLEALLAAELTIEEVAFDTLSDPRRNLAFVAEIMREDARLAEKPRTIEELADEDWTGIESVYIQKIADLLTEVSPEETARLIALTDLKGYEGIIFHTLLYQLPDNTDKERYFSMAVANPLIMKKITDGLFFGQNYSPPQSSFAARVYRLIGQRLFHEMPPLLKEAAEPAYLDVLLDRINDLVRLGLGHLISDMFLAFSGSNRSLLIERVAVDDNYSRNLISLLLESVGLPLVVIAIKGVADREKRTRLSRLLKPAD